MQIPLINVGKGESHLRTATGTLLIIVATYNSYWLLVIMGVLLIFTGTLYYCPVCHLLGIRSKASRENFYLSFLPRYNIQPVSIFNQEGRLSFANSRYKKIIPQISSSYDFGGEIPDNLETFIGNEAQLRFSFETADAVFQIMVQGVRPIDAVVCYISDITEVVNTNREIINTQKEIVCIMGEIGETRSEETGHHVRRVAEYSRLLAIGCGLSVEEAELIHMASPMHDIGKVGIPDSILTKPGKLTAEEYEIMKTHAKMGYDTLNHSERPILKAAAIIAGEHHEKFDGRGYPNGTAGKAIHLYGRITAVADVFDALGSDRVYKKAWPLAKITALFQEERGKHFDPDLVDFLLANLEQFRDIRIRFSDTKPGG
ncbi:MAG: HD domain-containing protein [Desulforhopalus sp.]|nr:HD domain-containing protein [Desulforhopalus sp.]